MELTTANWETIAELAKLGVRLARTPDFEQAIAQLLQGKVADLFTPKGRVLRSLMTEGEIDRAHTLPMDDPPEFDGTTCGFCRGDRRYLQCQRCRGAFENIDTALRDRISEAEQQQKAKAMEEKTRLFQKQYPSPTSGDWWARTGETDLQQIETPEQLLSALQAWVNPVANGPILGIWKNRVEALEELDSPERDRYISEIVRELNNKGKEQ